MFKVLRRRELQDPLRTMCKSYIVKHVCIQRIVALAATSRSLFISTEAANAARLFRPGQIQVVVLSV